MFCLNKVLGLDGKINTQGLIYIVALDVKDIHTNIRYDFVTHMTDMIHNEIVGAQGG